MLEKLIKDAYKLSKSGNCCRQCKNIAQTKQFIKGGDDR